MENFAYVNAADVEQVPSLLSDDWERSENDCGRNRSSRRAQGIH